MSANSIKREHGKKLKTGRPVKFEKYIEWNEIERSFNKPQTSLNL